MKKIILCILVIVLSIQLSAQENVSKEVEIKRLYESINEYQLKKDYVSLMNSILRILELDPSDIIAKQYLIAGLRGYFDVVSQNSYILDKSLKYIKQVDDIRQMPIGNMIAYYYQADRLDDLKVLLREIILSDTSKLTINLEPILVLDQKKHSDLFKEIIYTIRPFVKNKQLSSWLMLSIYSEDINGLEKLFQDLNVRMEDVNICTDSLEMKRLLNLYINQYSDRGAPVLGEIFTRFKECFESHDPLKLCVFYYKNNLVMELIDLLDRVEKEDLSTNPDFYAIRNIDQGSNPLLAKRLLSVYLKKLSRDQLSDISIIHHLYISKAYEELNYVIDRITNENIPLKVTLSDFLSFDVMNENINAGRIFKLFWENIDRKVIANTYDVSLLYDCTKKLYQTNLEFEAYVLLNRIKEMVELEEYDFKVLVIKGITSLLLKEELLALRIFGQITNLGYEEEKKYLANELNWWSGKTSSAILDRTRNSLTEYIVSGEELNSVNNKNEPNVLQSNEITGEQEHQDTLYHALLIGVKDYSEHKLNLVYPLSDIKSFAEVLLKNYAFAPQNVKLLENPTRADIFRALLEYKKDLDDNDNLLIFYAGHGWWDEDMEQGYWLPSNSESAVKVNWISNSELTETIRSIKTKHTLLISDACFSGSIFKTRSVFVDPDRNIQAIYDKSSRKAITSGTLVSVPDKSVFIEYLLKRLEENNEDYLPAEKLYLNFRDAVTNNSINKQRPLYGEIWNSGDEGGDFIFVRKKTNELDR